MSFSGHQTGPSHRGSGEIGARRGVEEVDPAGIVPEIRRLPGKRGRCRTQARDDLNAVAGDIPASGVGLEFAQYR